MPDLDRVLSGMFLLILVFLLLSRSGETNSIIQSFGNFVETQTAILQGTTTSGRTVIPGTNNTSSQIFAPKGNQ